MTKSKGQPQRVLSLWQDQGPETHIELYGAKFSDDFLGHGHPRQKVAWPSLQIVAVIFLGRVQIGALKHLEVPVR